MSLWIVDRDRPCTRDWPWLNVPVLYVGDGVGARSHFDWHLKERRWGKACVNDAVQLSGEDNAYVLAKAIEAIGSRP